MHTRMDAAGAVDAQNAPTAPWKTAQNAVSHSAHTHRRFRSEEEKKNKSKRRQPALHTKFQTVPPDPHQEEGSQSSSLERSDEALQHSAHFLGVGDQRFSLFDSDDFDSSTYLELRLKFVVRAVCVQEMVDVLTRVMAAEAL
jgi:hypothetical protein